jgi:predicted transposase/invertase (TIGR01784 family)
MAEKDIISKHLLKRIAIDIAHYLFKLDIQKAELIETEYQWVEDRRADLVMRVEEPEQYLLHIEIQNTNEDTMPIRMLRYCCEMISVYPQIDIRQYVVYIGRSSLRMANTIHKNGLDYRYTLIDMRQIDCQHFLTQNNPDALVLAILCDFKDQPTRFIVREILHRLDHLCEENLGQFRDYFTMLEILSHNRNLQQIVKEEQEMLSTIKLSELPSYEIGLERGLQDGLQQGFQQGIQQGLKNGLSQGMQQGIMTILIRNLEQRFGMLPQELQDRITQADIATLLRWSDMLLAAKYLEDIFGME